MGIAWIRGFRTKKDEMTSNVLVEGYDLKNCDRVASVLTNSRIIAMFDNFAHILVNKCPIYYCNKSSPVR